MRQSRWLLGLTVAVACHATLACRQAAPAELSRSGGTNAVVEPLQVSDVTQGNDGAMQQVTWPENGRLALKALYAGSWAPREPEGFDEQWFDESALVETYTKRRAGRRFWRGLRSSDGIMPLDLLIRDREGPAVGYVYVLNYRRPDDPSLAFSEVDYDDAPAVLHIRHRGRVRVLYDGKVVIDAPAPPPGEVAVARASVTMTDGFDVVLVKVGRGSPELGSSMNFELCISDDKGEPIEMQGWNTMRASDAPTELTQPASDG